MTEAKPSNPEISEIIEKINKLNLGQVSELIDELKEKYNIQETAIVQPTTTTPTSEKGKEEGGNVSIKLVEIKEGSNKIQIYNVIKNAIKELKGEEINVIQASELTKKEDKIILENVARDKAESVKSQLEEKGAKVEIK